MERKRGKPPLGYGTKPCKTKLGEFLRAKRLALKLSQVQLAALIGIHEPQLSRLEIGKDEHISQKMLERLTLTLQFKPDEFLEANTRPSNWFKLKSVHQAKPLIKDEIQPAVQENPKEIPPALPGRPLFLVVDGVRVYISAHDHFYTKSIKAFKQKMLKSHPDTAGKKAGLGRIRDLLKERERFITEQGKWYAKLGLEPPNHSNRPAPQKRIGIERLSE